MVSSISTSHLKSTLTDRHISRTNKNMTSMSKFKTMTSGMTLVLKKFRMLRRRMHYNKDINREGGGGGGGGGGWGGGGGGGG
ncbi:hypothetical protein LINPERHAP1_LOCUS41002, partial [Linum perenne]